METGDFLSLLKQEITLLPRKRCIFFLPSEGVERSHSPPPPALTTADAFSFRGIHRLSPSTIAGVLGKPFFFFFSMRVGRFKRPALPQRRNIVFFLGDSLPSSKLDTHMHSFKVLEIRDPDCQLGSPRFQTRLLCRFSFFSYQ